MWNVLFDLGFVAIFTGVLPSRSGAPPPPAATAFLVIVRVFGAAMWPFGSRVRFVFHETRAVPTRGGRT